MPNIGAGRPPELEGDDPGFPEIALVRDVLAIPSPGHVADPDEWMEHRAVDGPVDLGNGVMLERLRADDIAEQVIHASLPRGLRHEPTRQFGQLYSFWREIPAEEWQADLQHMDNWDPSQALSEAVVLSRFVLDNAHGYEFAGRVFDRDDDHRRIAPLTGYDGRTAYRARRTRFWFTDADAAELRTLLDQYRAVKDTLPDRVKRALWQAERSAQSRYITEATTHIVTGLEALLNTDANEKITQQFVKRSRQLADELAIATSNRYWNWIYKKRSQVVHGAESQLVAPTGWYESGDEPPADVTKIAKAQDVLRGVVRRAIENDDFRAVFEDATAIRARWPIE
jgi:hypothetical protein